MRKIIIIKLILIFLLLNFVSGCQTNDVSDMTLTDESIVSRELIDREGVLPDDIKKITSKTDVSPPILHSDEFYKPIQLEFPLNTSGAEDSPFIMPDGKTMYFFFTPDVRIPPNKQLLDSVTGIWVSTKYEETWSKPSRVWLQDEDKLALDGAQFVRENEMWFASAREGYEGINIFIANFIDGRWSNIRYMGDKLMKDYNVGELHIYESELYYHSNRAGGKGDYDIWVTKKSGNDWTEPINLIDINSTGLDGFPYISSDGEELWFARTYLGTPAIYRSIKINDKWQQPELIISQFAGEPTLDDAGNLYFTHHYYKNNIMIESDIYVAKKIKDK